MKDRLYTKLLEELLSNETISTHEAILVVCGGANDATVLMSFGFSNVTISNLDPRHSCESFAPYTWDYQNAEELTYQDSSFDWVIVHAGLHHCYSPHRALTEMIRVARTGCLVFESRNSMIMRLGIKLGLVARYELEAVHGNDLKYGGVQNTAVPNFVYRWTEDELINIVNTYLPQYKDNKVEFRYKLRFPFKRFQRHTSKLVRTVAYIAYYPVRIFSFLFPKQCNEFGVIIKKGTSLHPWLLLEGDKLVSDSSYYATRFKI